MENITKLELIELKKIILNQLSNNNIYCIDEVAQIFKIELYKDNNFNILNQIIRDTKEEYIKQFLVKCSLPSTASRNKEYIINQLLEFISILKDNKVQIGKFDSRGNYRVQSNNKIYHNFYSIYDGFTTKKELFDSIINFNKGYNFYKQMEELKNS